MKKYVILSLITTLLFCVTNFLSAQSPTFWGTESFEGDPATFEWGEVCTNNPACNSGPEKGFHLQSDGLMEDSKYLRSKKPNNNLINILEKQFDFSELTVAKIEFKYKVPSAGVLELSYSTDGVTYTSLWTAPAAGDNLIQDYAQVLDFTWTTDVYLRFTATAKNVMLDNIKVYDPPKDLCFSYDLAGNRTGTEITVSLVDETEVASIIQNNIPNVSLSANSAEDENPSFTEETISADNFNVYPNPTNNLLNISTAGSGQSYPVEVYNEVGKLVTTTTLAGQEQIDVSTWVSGSYYVYIRSGNEKLIYRVIKI